MSELPAPLLSHPELSQWLSFSEPGFVHIRSGRVELGQGVSAAFASITAAEFHISREQVKLISGDTRCCPNEGFTAGSKSVSDGGMSLRIVSRIAFSLLTQKAATLLQADPGDIIIKQGQVLHKHAETGLTLWDLAQGINWDVAVPEDSAATMALAAESKIKQSFPPNNLKQRLSGLEFIHDYELPGMLHARAVTPLNYRARLNKSIDEVAALLPKDVSVVNQNSFLAVVSQREERVVAAAKQLHELSIWSSDEVSMETTAHSHPLDGLAFDTVIDLRSERGGTQANSATVSVQIERPCLTHASIGPGCALAHFSDNKLTVWSHSQGVFSLRAAIAKMLALELDSVHVIHMPGAGCYGHNSADDVAADAALTAMLKPDIPIRMQYSRADEFQKSYQPDAQQPARHERRYQSTFSDAVPCCRENR